MNNLLINNFMANKQHDAGFSLVEVLIATLLFSIIMLGLINYQQALIAKHHYFYTRLQAEQIAFQLLDSYPNIAEHIVPTNWQYHVNTSTYNHQCRMVFVTITLPSKQTIQQNRLMCN